MHLPAVLGQELFVLRSATSAKSQNIRRQNAEVSGHTPSTPALSWRKTAASPSQVRHAACLMALALEAALFLHLIGCVSQFRFRLPFSVVAGTPTTCMLASKVHTGHPIGLKMRHLRSAASEALLESSAYRTAVKQL